MDASEREGMRAALLRQREALVQAGDVEIPAEADGETVHKPDEDATPLNEMHQVIASNRNREHAEQLRRIDDALERLRDDPEGFGISEDCDEPIPRRRLELMPWARLCAACQAEAEDDGSAGRRHITDYR